MDVETKTSRDWAKVVDTETPSRLSLISAICHIGFGIGSDIGILSKLLAHKIR